MTKGRTPKTHEGTVSVGAIYAHHADMPLIELEMTGFKEPKAQLTLAQATEIAHHILEQIEVARADAFLIRWGRENLELTPGQLAALLVKFRNARETIDRPGRTTSVQTG